MASQSSGESTVRVGVIGALGKMGSEVVKAVLEDTQLTLVGAVDTQQAGQKITDVLGLSAHDSSVLLQADLHSMLRETQPDVCVDFTNPTVVFRNALTLIEYNCRPLVGTTGLSTDQLAQLNNTLKQCQLSGAVIPNFAIGAVLMMRFAEEASKYFDHAEIIEYHHNQKFDAPSGTAVSTAERMAKVRETNNLGPFGKTNVQDHELITGARGGKAEHNIQIHSVRLPGYVAHQAVIFGSKGQTLTLKHDTQDRTCFMPGVVLAAKKLMTHTPGLVTSLDAFL